MDGVVLVEVLENGSIVHNGLCRTLCDVARVASGREIRFIPPSSREEAVEWSQNYRSEDNLIALGLRK